MEANMQGNSQNVNINSTTYAITQWPKDERPREKLLEQGAQALSDSELLAIFLRTGINGITAVDLARQIIEQTGGLRGLMTLTSQQICEIKGLGTATAATLLACLEISQRVLKEDLQRGQPLSRPKDVYAYLDSKLRHRKREIFAIIYLDCRHRVIAYDELFVGTLSGAPVYPREVVAAVLHHHAAAVILTHNHPSGIAEPSECDRQITIRLRDALKLIDVSLLDHLVIGDGEYVSLSEQGII